MADWTKEDDEVFEADLRNPENIKKLPHTWDILLIALLNNRFDINGPFFNLKYIWIDTHYKLIQLQQNELNWDCRLASIYTQEQSAWEL